MWRASVFRNARHQRPFSTSSVAMARLRIGFVPEHFSTPLAFAQRHYDLNADLIPEPLGTGALTARLKADTGTPKPLDVAIGLTEGFVADLGKAKTEGKDMGYGLAGTYVESPLCWAIVTGRLSMTKMAERPSFANTSDPSVGAKRDGLDSVADLKGTRVGVSRIGSGSYVMSYVLADQNGWLEKG